MILDNIIDKYFHKTSSIDSIAAKQISNFNIKKLVILFKQKKTNQNLYKNL